MFLYAFKISSFAICLHVYLTATKAEPAKVTLKGKNMEEDLQNVVEKQSQLTNSQP